MFSIAFALVVLLAFFILQPFLLDKFGPWGKLAQVFQAESSPILAPVSMVAGAIGICGYRGLKVSVGKDGIYLATSRLMLCHPPLFIPWHSIKSAQSHELLWDKSFIFTVGEPKITTIKLPKSVFSSSTIPALLITESTSLNA